MESLRLNFRVNDNSKRKFYDDYVYERLKEAEVQMKENTKKYSKEELLEIMNTTIDAYENESN